MNCTSQRQYTWAQGQPTTILEPCFGALVAGGCCWETGTQQNAHVFSELGRRATPAPLWVGVTGKFWHVAQEKNPYQPQSSHSQLIAQPGRHCFTGTKVLRAGTLVLCCSDGKELPSMRLKSGPGKQRCCSPQLGFTISALSPGKPTASRSGVQTGWERVSPLQTLASFTCCQLYILPN